MIQMPVEEMFFRVFHHHEFDVVEMSLSSYLMARSKGAWEYEAIPVFLSRMFRHSAIFVRKDRGLDEPDKAQRLPHRRAGICADRGNDGAGHPAGRFRRQPARHDLVHRRPGAAGPAREVSARHSGRDDHPRDRTKPQPDAGRRRARRADQRAQSILLPAQSEHRAAVPRPRRRRAGLLPAHRHPSRSCTWSACGARSSSKNPGSRRR